MASTDTVVPFEVPEQMRAFAEKGVAQARDNYAKMKDVAQSSNSAIEAVLTAATKGAGEYNAKVMDIIKTNTHATFDFAQELSSVKSPSQLMEIWTAHIRKQVETMTAQSKELAELAQKVATETAEPIKSSASKMFTPPSP
jgi:phasin